MTYDELQQELAVRTSERDVARRLFNECTDRCRERTAYYAELLRELEEYRNGSRH